MISHDSFKNTFTIQISFVIIFHIKTQRRLLDMNIVLDSRKVLNAIYNLLEDNSYTLVVKYVWVKWQKN